MQYAKSCREAPIWSTYSRAGRAAGHAHGHRGRSQPNCGSTIGMDFSIVNGRFAMLQNTGGLLTTAAAAGLEDCRRRAGTSPRRSRTGMCSWPLKPANHELRSKLGRSPTDDAEEEEEKNPSARKHQVPILIALQFVPLYHRPRSDTLATESQRIHPQRSDHPGQRGTSAQPDYPTPVQHHRRTPRRADAHRGGPDPEQFQRHVQAQCRYGAICRSSGEPEGTTA